MTSTCEEFSSHIYSLRHALEDYFYLLSRNYSRKRALDFVCERYGLDRRDRMVLYRTIFRPDEASERRGKIISPEEVAGKRLVIDGYNVLTTIYAALARKPLLLSLDGIVRDLMSIGKGGRIPVALTLLIEYVSRLRPGKVVMIFDRQRSGSGVISAMTRFILAKMGVRGTAYPVSRADKTVVLYPGDVVSSSDSAVVSAAGKILDIGGILAKIISPECITNIRCVLGYEALTP